MFRLLIFFSFLLNQEVILLIDNNKVNSFNNFFYIAYNFTYFNFLFNEKKDLKLILIDILLNWCFILA